MDTVPQMPPRDHALAAARAELDFWIAIADRRRLIPAEKVEMRRVLERWSAIRRAMAGVAS